MGSSPIIKRYILQIDSSGNIIKTIDLDNTGYYEKNELLEIVFTQGMNRLGYERKKIGGSIV